MEAKKKDGRANNGGFRPGSGRKATEKTVTTGFRVHEESLNVIRKAGFPINAEVNSLIKKIAKKIQKSQK